MDHQSPSDQSKKMLIIGPLPPPIGGSPVTLEAMLNEFRSYPQIQVTVINTSPRRDVKKKMTGFNLEKVQRMFRILAQYQKELRESDAILAFANDLFAFILIPLLLLQARINRKPFYLKPVGSGLDLFMESRGKLVKVLMLKVLKSTNGVLAQTKYLTDWLLKAGCPNVIYLPGCRPHQSLVFPTRPPSSECKMIFIAHITLRKGPLVLLDALRLLQQRGALAVACDFYGPIHDNVHDEFLKGIETIPGVRHMGIAETKMATRIIAQYDVLILPTFFDSEGHPGVLIEAMHAGVPVISTRIRTISELVKDGVNGFLVPSQDSAALADAIETLALDPALREQMGQANLRIGHDFRSDVVVEKLVRLIFPDLPLVQKDPLPGSEGQ